jgi:multidrug resistance efflux pump
LQTEIWSKRTSRKILIGFGVAVSFLGVWCAVERYWLTPREHKSAKVALAQIDEIQDFASLSDQDFEAREKQAEQKVEVAKHAALTQRDELIALSLDLYLNDTKDDRDEVRRALLDWERHIPIEGSRTEFGKKLDLTGTEMKTLIRQTLHKELD